MNSWESDWKEIGMKDFVKALEDYVPYNEQEARDKELFLAFVRKNSDCLERSNAAGHVTVSAWTVNQTRTKTLMVYHNIYNSWSWIGGHADGDDNLPAVALRELQEETGIMGADFRQDGIFSIEILTVDGHEKRGQYVPSHLHYNVTYLIEADEMSPIRSKEDENSGVRWMTFEEAMEASTEPWMVERIYRKLVAKL